MRLAARHFCLLVTDLLPVNYQDCHYSKNVGSKIDLVPVNCQDCHFRKLLVVSIVEYVFVFLGVPGFLVGNSALLELFVIMSQINTPISKTLCCRFMDELLLVINSW